MSDAWATAEAIRNGTARAADVVGAALDRIAATDGGINAFTVVTSDSALDRAARVDAGEVSGPLAGVPVAVKDHVWLAGQPATNGSRALRDFIPSRSCVAVERLLDAGAIVVGKTNNPEFCYRGVTENALFGVTRNPRDGSRTAGGSSGGSAAAVAAGMVPLAVGTDGGGSIRIPSAFCGVYGLKPTFGLVPKMPGFRGWPTLSVTGPIAGSVRDLALALEIMAGPAAEDQLSWSGAAGAYRDSVEASSWSGLRVAVSADLGIAALDDDVRACFESAVRRAGVLPYAATLPTADPGPLWDAIALPEGYASEGALVESAPHLVGADAAAICLAGKDISARAYLDAQVARQRYAQRWDAVFDEVDIVLSAAMPVTAFPTGRLAPPAVGGKPVPDSFDAWCALALPANLAGLPAASVPIGTGRDDLPVGLQILGRRGDDATVLRVAAIVDHAMRGVVRAG